MKNQQSQKAKWSYGIAQSNLLLIWSIFVLIFHVCENRNVLAIKACPPSDIILPCRCLLRGKELQIWCSHSNLPQIMEGIKAVNQHIKSPIDEFVLENNQLPALPGRFFGSLQIMRLMLRYNSLERVSNGWLNELEDSLVEVYIVEPQLRSIPMESLNGMINMIAITIESHELKHLPDFSGLPNLTYLSVQSASIIELQPSLFRHLPKVQNLYIRGGQRLNRLEAGLLDKLISLEKIDFSQNGIKWIHLRALNHLPNLVSLKLAHNRLSDVRMVGRIVKDMENLKLLYLDNNMINVIKEGSFVDLPNLREIHLNDNNIREIEYGAFLRSPMLKTIYLQNNEIKRVHPESFLQSSDGGIETVYMYNNNIDQVDELRSLLDSLPALRFLDISNNYLTAIPFGALRGHGTLEQLHLNSNLIHKIERDAFIAMPALRELRLRNNSLSQELPMPFWNLPGLRGLDLAQNKFSLIDSFLLAGLPSLRRLDLSENHLVTVDPSAFQHNAMIETLNISFNKLSAVNPETFRNLDRLFEVDLSFNKLTAIYLGLPKIVERLSLRGNLLTSLPPSGSKSLILPNLRMLDISLNRIEHIPKNAFKGVPQLHVLSLAYNRLQFLDDTAFIGAQQLELLHLQFNEISKIDERTFLVLPELRNLNLRGNKLEIITDNHFSNNTLLEQLDLSRNLIHTIAPTAFEAQRSLEYLDLSENNLVDKSISFSDLKNLRNIDLSYNQITRVHADVVSAWHNVVQILLSNNLIAELKHGTFQKMPSLQYLDLSSNEISTIEPGAFNHLPSLLELALADNKLIELNDEAFGNLPNLLAAHFQYNSLRHISPNSFYNSPSILFLNLSHNAFRTMENLELRNMRNLEVLDLSANEIKMVPTMPLKALNWLVELRMDNNRICEIEGSPFETMPRLRLLSLRNNHLKLMKEKTFRNLRGNIAVLDVDGNPIECSCKMRWLSDWLHENNFPDPGPRCKDGRLLRSFQIEKSLCTDDREKNQRTANRSSVGVDKNPQQLPLLNEHGDIFEGERQDLSDECDSYVLPPDDRPLAGESEYFYDQYVNYSPGNNTTPLDLSTPVDIDPSHTVFNAYKKPDANYSLNLNNTVLNTNYFKQRPQHFSVSPFTFFGYPLPSLSLGRLFGARQSKRKHRGEHISDVSSTRPSNEAHLRHLMETQPGIQYAKVRMYQPSNAEFDKYLRQDSRNQATSRSNHKQYHDVTARNPISTDLDSGEPTSHDSTLATGKFRTAFKEPASIEHGGFRPILTEGTYGGFKPVPNPENTRESNFVPFKTTSVHPIGNGSSSNTEFSYKRNIQKVKEGSFLPAKNYDEHKKPATPALRLQETKIHSVTQSSNEAMAEISLVTVNTRSTTPMPTTQQTIDSESEDLISTETEFYSDLESHSKQPPHPSTTEVDTILLIPPPEEYAAQLSQHSWIKPQKPPNEQQQEGTSNQPSIFDRTRQSESLSGVASRSSTISKVFTHQTRNQFLPSAEEYYHRPTTLNDELVLSLANGDERMHVQADAQKGSRLDSKAVNHINRKDGMDWYYESFNERKHYPSFANDQDFNQEDAGDNEGSDHSRYSAACGKRIHGVSYICISICFYIRHSHSRSFFY